MIELIQQKTKFNLNVSYIIFISIFLNIQINKHQISHVIIKVKKIINFTYSLIILSRYIQYLRKTHLVISIIDIFYSIIYFHMILSKLKYLLKRIIKMHICTVKS